MNAVRRLSALAAIMIVGVSVTACYDVHGYVVLVNDTQRTLTIHRNKAGNPQQVSLPNGRRKDVTWMILDSGILNISSGPCHYAYKLPEMGVNHPWGLETLYPVEARLNAKFNLHLTPEYARGWTPAKDWRPERKIEFTLNPTKTCSGQAAD